MLVLGDIAGDPDVAAGGLCAVRHGAVIARIGGGLAAGMAYPTTLALITALWAPGPGRTKSIALWSGIGGAIAALGPLARGDAARAVLVGLGVPADAAARGGGDRHGVALRAGARERGHRARGQPRRDPLARARSARSSSRSTSRRSRTPGTSSAGARRHRRVAALVLFCLRQRRGGATRCTTSRSPRGRRSGSPRAQGSSCSAR